MPYKDPAQARAYDIERGARRRREWIAEHGPCAQCGSADRLEVDHIDPASKVYRICNVWTFGREKREAELAKCQVLCHVCHTDKTVHERGWSYHGLGGYQRGCRCDICVERMRESDRARYRANREKILQQRRERYAKQRIAA